MQQNNVLTGYVEDFHLNETTFDVQYHNFQSKGYAESTSGGIVGKYVETGLIFSFDFLFYPKHK